MVVLGYNTPTDNVYAPKEPPYLRVFHHNLSIQAAALSERHLGRGDRQGRQGRRLQPARRLRHRGPDRRDRHQDDDRGDEVISYDCDMALGEYIRNTTFNFAKHRRPEHYKLITNGPA